MSAPKKINWADEFDDSDEGEYVQPEPEPVTPPVNAWKPKQSQSQPQPQQPQQQQQQQRQDPRQDNRGGPQAQQQQQPRQDTRQDNRGGGGGFDRGGYNNNSFGSRGGQDSRGGGGGFNDRRGGGSNFSGGGGGYRGDARNAPNDGLSARDRRLGRTAPSGGGNRQSVSRGGDVRGNIGGPAPKEEPKQTQPQAVRKCSVV
jgi:hypothetical protein